MYGSVEGTVASRLNEQKLNPVNMVIFYIHRCGSGLSFPSTIAHNYKYTDAHASAEKSNGHGFTSEPASSAGLARTGRHAPAPRGCDPSPVSQQHVLRSERFGASQVRDAAQCPALIDTYTDGEIADVLNERGVRTVVTTPWTAARVGRLRAIYHLTDRRTRLIAQGFLTPEDVATRYDVVVSTVHLWRRRGLLRAHPINDRGDYLYEIPPEDLPAKYAHKREYQVEPVTSTPNTSRGAV
jgi:hypothetical protein